MTLSRGETYIASRDVKDGIMILDTTLANPIGLKTGDKIVSIDGKEYEKFFDTYNGILLGSQVTVNRNGKDTVLTIPVDYINTFKDNENPYFYYPRLPFTVVEIPDSSHNAPVGPASGGRYTVRFRYSHTVFRPGFGHNQIICRTRRDAPSRTRRHSGIRRSENISGRHHRGKGIAGAL